MLKLFINPQGKKNTISRNIYGHFTEHLGRCIYNGIYVGEDSEIPNTHGIRNDVIEALKEIGTPVLRWPGGCFADEYHWRDGIGDKATRKKMINTNWGGVTEDNSFGTHEFMELCELVGCEPYIAGNVGSGTVQELSEWVEYMTSDDDSPMANLRRKNGREKAWKLKYLGIGNENWGCGGNMRPEYYADVYRRYQTFCKNYSGNELYKVACGPNADDYNWTEKLLDSVKKWHTKAISLHYYTVPTGSWVSSKGKATVFSDEEYYDTIKRTLYMEEIIKRHLNIMDRYDPEHEIGLIVDEWGIWCDVEEGTNPGFLYQQNTMRDALVAAINFDIFNKHSDRIVMANIAQAVNVLQSVILTEGAKMIKTPTFHVFNMYNCHHDATLLGSFMENVKENDIPTLSHTASLSPDGSVNLTLSNCSLDMAQELDLMLVNHDVKEISGRILTGEIHSHNTFDAPETVVPTEYTGAKLENGRVTLTVPPASVISLKIKA